METNSKTNFLFQILIFSYFISITAVRGLNDIANFSSCNGSIADCDEELEILMQSEISRRILENKKYISPGALKGDQPVCEGSASGKPYTGNSGCVPAPSNTPRRDCEQYYRCQG
ncbi:protein RALF-like 32 [Olea europaea var. sylvestris]|uniref:protein RALF-like 32 n=1 Tax=Olea europaea var. sylvestris TaxID=158386 RepID=UPI000C1D71A8|nr:protein RALF-like 32 [Olea europaea var. sylvestris]